MIAVIQLINKVCGLPFSWADEELAGAFAAQLAVCIANLRAMEDMSDNLTEARAETRLFAKLLASCRDLASRSERDPVSVCRRVRDLAREFTSSISSALLLYTEHKVWREAPQPQPWTLALALALTLTPHLTLTLTLTLTLALIRWRAASRSGTAV